MNTFYETEEKKIARVKEAERVLIDNGIEEDEAETVVEAIWDAYRDDTFPEYIY